MDLVINLVVDEQMHVAMVWPIPVGFKLDHFFNGSNSSFSAA